MIQWRMPVGFEALLVAYEQYALKVVSGRSIPVVRLLWEQVDRVRFSAPRHNF